MNENSVDVGDLIDDYCPHCRLLLSHDVAAVVEGEVKKVRCRTCLNEHPYRHGKGGRKEKRRPPRSTQSRSSAASDVYKRQPIPISITLAASRKS